MVSMKLRTWLWRCGGLVGMSERGAMGMFNFYRSGGGMWLVNHVR